MLSVSLENMYIKFSTNTRSFKASNLRTVMITSTSFQVDTQMVLPQTKYISIPYTSFQVLKNVLKEMCTEGNIYWNLINNHHGMPQIPYA